MEHSSDRLQRATHQGCNWHVVLHSDSFQKAWWFSVFSPDDHPLRGICSTRCVNFAHDGSNIPGHDSETAQMRRMRHSHTAEKKRMHLNCADLLQMHDLSALASRRPKSGLWKTQVASTSAVDALPSRRPILADLLQLRLLARHFCFQQGDAPL